MSIQANFRSLFGSLQRFVAVLIWCVHIICKEMWKLNTNCSLHKLSVLDWPYFENKSKATC